LTTARQLDGNAAEQPDGKTAGRQTPQRTRITARSLLFWPLKPIWRLFLRIVPATDPWERIGYRVPARKFGLGSTHDFSWYFEGKSSVSVSSIDDIENWLRGCEYVSDPDLFRVDDYWQHPQTFEQIRRGDCEDFALWAWRKLIELGYDADFVGGRCLPWTPRSEAGDRGHAWVIFRQDGQSFLFETTSKNKATMIRPLAEVSSGYRPELGVDRHRKSFAFGGALITMREREFAR
jgi:hypothetical protein